MQSLQLLSIKQDHLPFAEVDTSVFVQEVFRLVRFQPGNSQARLKLSR
jgi:hypothetical protein